VAQTAAGLIADNKAFRPYKGGLDAARQPISSRTVASHPLTLALSPMKGGEGNPLRRLDLTPMCFCGSDELVLSGSEFGLEIRAIFWTRH